MRSLTHQEITGISITKHILTTLKSTLYLGIFNGENVIVQQSTSFVQPIPNLEIIGKWNSETEYDTIYKFENLVVPQFIRPVKEDGLVDPYLVLFMNPDIMKTLKLKGNEYPTIISYYYYNLPLGDNTKYFEAAAVGIKESLNTNFYQIYIDGVDDKIPGQLIQELIFRGIIVFSNTLGEKIRLHPNISQVFDMSNMLLEPTFITGYENYILEKEDIQSLLTLDDVISRNSQDGLSIPPFAKDYVEYINMNIESTFSITKGPYNSIDEVPDLTLFSAFGIYFLYQNREDLIDKFNRFNNDTSKIVFRVISTGDIGVGTKSKYEIIPMDEIKNRIKMCNPKDDLLLFEILGLLALFNIERDELTELLNKRYRKLTQSYSRVWDENNSFPNIMKVRKEYNPADAEDIDNTEIIINYNLDGQDLYLAANALEDLIREIVIKEFKTEDPTIIREYSGSNVSFYISIPSKINADQLRKRIVNIDKTKEFNENINKPQVKLPIVTHLKFKLPNSNRKYITGLTRFMNKELTKHLGEKYTLDQRVINTDTGKKLEFTISVFAPVDKKELKRLLIQQTTTKEYVKLFK